MPKEKTFTCPDCGLEVSFSRNIAKVRRKKSEKRQANGRRLAARLPRDPVTGRFLKSGTKISGKRKRSTRKGKEPEESSSKRYEYYRE